MKIYLIRLLITEPSLCSENINFHDTFFLKPKTNLFLNFDNYIQLNIHHAC